MNGSAEAQVDLNSFGIDLDDAAADITIGNAGDVSGLSIIGELSGGSFTDQVDVLASTIMEDATALGIFDSAGISGRDATLDTADSPSVNTAAGVDQTLITAGPSGGDISGQSLSGVNASASTIGDPSLTDYQGGSTGGGDVANVDLSGSVSGIEDVDMLGGQVGVNLISGKAFGNFDADASSIKGDAFSTSDTDAYGIYDADSDGHISLSGNIVAQAVLSNTVVASSINGDASATATGDAIGMGGYSVTINTSGSLTATANSSADTDSSSVWGDATA